MSTLEPESMINTCLMEGYSQYLFSSRISNARAKMYVNFVRKFYNFIGKSYLDIEKHDIINYLSFLLDNEHLQESSLYRHLLAIKKFFEYLISRGDVVTNPGVEISIKSCRKSRFSNENDNKE